ncbi:MAG: Ger(x)C family spore germination C-terminal domain-containing protein, partial [Oscillospiraceae bacterium]
LQTFSFLTSNFFARQNARLIICQGKASDVLSSKTNQGIIPCEMLENLIKNSNQNGFVQDVKLFNFNRSLKNKYESASLPIIQIVEQTTEENKIEDVSNIKVNGTAILVDGKMSGSLNQSQTRGLLWIRDEIDKTTIKASDNAYEEAAIQIISTKSKIIPTFQNDKVKMKLIIEADGCLNEAVLREDANVDMSDLSGLEKNCEEIIKAECIDAFNAGVVENNADIFNFGNLTYKYNVSLWKKLHTDWRNNCDEIEFSVVPTVKIKRVGTQFKTKV